MMRVKASENDAGNTDLQGNRDGIGNLSIIGWSHDARSKSPAVQILFEADGRSGAKCGRNLEAGTENLSRRDADENYEAEDADPNQDAATTSRFGRRCCHGARGMPNSHQVKRGFGLVGSLV